MVKYYIFGYILTCANLMHTSFVHISCTLLCSWDTFKLHPTRSIADIEACAATNEYSIKYPPLLSIDLDHVVPDELHLFLRIMDILIENLISYAVELDIRATRKQTDLLQEATLKKMQAKYPVLWCVLPNLEEKREVRRALLDVSWICTKTKGPIITASTIS